MYVITEEGRIYEGLALTPEEAEIFKELGEGDEINAHSSSYVTRDSCRTIAAYLCSNFILVHRKSPEQLPTVEDITIANNFPGIANA